MILKKLIMILGCLTILMGRQVVATEQIILGINNTNNEGFYYEDNELKGELGRQLQCALNESNIAYKSRLLPLTRLMVMLESGGIDIAVGLAQTEQRDNSGIYTKPIVELSFALVSGKSAFKSSEEARGKTIATVRASNMVAMIKALNAKVYELSDYLQVISMLDNKRIDGAVLPVNIIAALNEERKQSFNYIILQTERIGFYISQRSDQVDMLLLRISV